MQMAVETGSFYLSCPVDVVLAEMLTSKSRMIRLKREMIGRERRGRTSETKELK